MLLSYLKTKYREHLEEGWAAFEIGNLQKAEQHFRQVVVHEDDLENSPLMAIEAHAGLGAVNLRHKDLFEAHRWYAESYHLLDRYYATKWPSRLNWKKFDDRPAMRTLIGLGHLAYEKKDFIRARAYYNRLLKLDPRDELGVKYFLDALDSGISFHELQLSQ